MSKPNRCPSCNGSGELCCESFLWLCESIRDSAAPTPEGIVFENDGGGKRVGFSNRHGVTCFFEHCPFCGKQLS